MVALQTEELDILNAKLQHVKFQLKLVKETHATVELNKLRAPVRSSAAQNAVNAPAKESENARFGDLDAVEMLANPVMKRKAWARMPIAHRFAM